MSMQDHSPSRHLVDRETTEFLDSFVPFDLHDHTLGAIRQQQEDDLAALPDPLLDYPEILRTEHLVPGFGGAPDVRVLVYTPRPTPTAFPDESHVSLPALVWIHGGGYVLGSAETDDQRSFFLSQQLQAVVVNVDYRLAPEATGTSAAEDCYAALSWLHAHADALGVDTDRIAVGGMSAGGGIAAGTVLMARDLGTVPVCHQVLIYPMLDDRTVTREPANPLTGEFLWTRDNNAYGWSSVLGYSPSQATLNAPTHAPAPYLAPARVESVAGLPPTFIGVGSLDLFLEEDLTFAQRLLAAGVPTELHVYPGGYHAFDASEGARITQQLIKDYVGSLATAFSRGHISDPIP